MSLSHSEPCLLPVLIMYEPFVMVSTFASSVCRLNFWSLLYYPFFFLVAVQGHKASYRTNSVYYAYFINVIGNRMLLLCAELLIMLGHIVIAIFLKFFLAASTKPIFSLPFLSVVFVLGWVVDHGPFIKELIIARFSIY